MNVTMNINGTEISSDVEPRTLLVHYLRDGTLRSCVNLALLNSGR